MNILQTNYEALGVDWLQTVSRAKWDALTDKLSVRIVDDDSTTVHMVDIKRAELDYPHIRQALRVSEKYWNDDNLAGYLSKWAYRIAAEKHTPQMFFASMLPRKSIFSHTDGAWVAQLVKVELSEIEVWMHWRSRTIWAHGVALTGRRTTNTGFSMRFWS